MLICYSEVMKKILFGLFAHPDDEAFGPSGTLLKLKEEGYDIHFILLTDGEAGTNPDGVGDLGAVRLEEWRAAATIFGAHSTHALHYPDGALDTVPADELYSTTKAIISNLLVSYRNPSKVSFMTFEPHGLTGHHDHIAASHLTTKLAHEYSAEVWYYCLDSTQAPLGGTAYYEPCAREDSYITTRVDVSEQLTDKFRVIDTHTSQRADAANLKALGEERLSIECFRVEA